MKKYLFVVPSLSKGGAERVVSLLASGLVQINGNDVTVLRYFKTENDYSVDDKVKIITLSEGYEEDYNKLNKVKVLKRVRQIIKKEAPDHIIPFLRHINLQTYLASPRKFRKKIIFTIRNSPYEKRNKIAVIHDYLINHTNRTIVQNQKQKDYFSLEAQSRISILPNPVKTEFLEENARLDSENYIAVSSGRLLEQKNFPMLIRAFCNFACDKEDVFLHIYGEGEDKEKLQQLIDEVDCTRNIKLMGRSNDLVSIYKSVNLYILSSNFEGMPNALLEAMAIGLPCISTDCPTGPSEMIVNGENGLLVPVDDAEKMREAIEYMYNNRDKAEEMGKRAREFVSENYRIEKIVDRFLEIVDQN